MTLLEPLSQHILELQMLLVLQDMMELLPQHKFSVRLVGIGQLLQDALLRVIISFCCLNILEDFENASPYFWFFFFYAIEKLLTGFLNEHPRFGMNQSLI